MKRIFLSSVIFAMQAYAGTAMAVVESETFNPSISVYGGTGTEQPWVEESPPNIFPVRSGGGIMVVGGFDTYDLLLTGFNFSVPEDAEILGIEATVTRFWTPTVGTSAVDKQISLMKLGFESGDNKASASAWPTTATPAVYGGASDLWGQTWLPTDVNATNFGIVVQATVTGVGPFTNAEVRVTAAQMTVTYQRPCPSNLDLTGCDVSFQTASIKVDERTAGKEKVQASLGKGGALTQTNFGDPTVTDGQTTALCVYDATSALVSAFVVDAAGLICGDKPCWKSSGDPYPDGKGFSYKDAGGGRDGITQVKLTAGEAGKTKAQFKGANKTGVLVLGTAAGLDGETSATIQIRGDDPALCLSSGISDVSKNSGGQFQGKK